MRASNSGGTTDGSILHFTTSAAAGTPPAATTVAASSITSTGATLNATVNPKGSATTYSFIYGTSSTLSSGTTPPRRSRPEAGRAPQSETAALTGLTSDTTYYFEVRATNSGGTTDGSILHFTTSASRHPACRHDDGGHSDHGHRRHAQRDASTRRGATTYSFVYGTNSTLSSGTTTTAQSAGSGTMHVSETAALSGLTPGTTYYFEVQATNAGGTTDGDDPELHNRAALRRSFSSPAASSPPTSPPARDRSS